MRIADVNPLVQFLLTVVGSTAVVCLIAVAVTKAMRGAKNRPPALGGALWAFLFFSSGRMPPPPPQSQIEQETREKKNREIGRSDSDV